MSLVDNNPAIDGLVQASLESDNKNLIWIPCSKITDIEPTQINNVYCATHNDDVDDCYNYYGGDNKIILLLLGSSEECTPTLVSEFARIYSLPTHKYNNNDSQFRRYSTLLSQRNKVISGFTKYEGNYYMVAKRRFHHCYSLYGFCSACGILRCSPVWCICGHKELSDGWTSNNTKLDEFIKKSQLQTNSPNHAYLEWIPFDCIYERKHYNTQLYGLSTCAYVKLIPLEITDETRDLYYDKVNYSIINYASCLLNSLNNY